MSFMYLAIEDELSEEVGSKLAKGILGENLGIKALRRGGFGYLRTKIENFAQMSKHYPVFLITDLDDEICAPTLKAKWFRGIEKPEAFVFRVAVREVESWVLADADRFADYLGVSQALMPKNPDDLDDPKATLIGIARKAKRPLRQDIVPERGALAIQGLGYNKALCRFVRERWDWRVAANRSNSLNRACKRIAELGEN